jgi:hypothetical protein
MLKDELQAAYIAGDYRRVLGLMAANSGHKGDVRALLDDWGEAADWVPEYEPTHLEVDGYPVVVQGTFSLAVVEYLDGTRRGIFRGEPEIFSEACELLETEAKNKVTYK